MLPEARKEIADAMWETIVQNGVDCIFENKLPAQEEFNYTETPLDTVPVLVQHTPEGGTATYTQRDIDRSTNDRAAVVFSNLKKSEMKVRILIDYKCVLAVAILKAFKQHARRYSSRRCAKTMCWFLPPLMWLLCTMGARCLKRFVMSRHVPRTISMLRAIA